MMYDWMDGMVFILLDWFLFYWVVGVDGDVILVIFVFVYLNVVFFRIYLVEERKNVFN